MEDLPGVSHHAFSSVLGGGTGWWQRYEQMAGRFGNRRKPTFANGVWQGYTREFLVQFFPWLGADNVLKEQLR